MPNIIIALIIIATAGGGVTLAAENTMPGDTLYPMKVELNEGIRSVLAVSEESQAYWDIRRAERRLEEAEKLAVVNRLTADDRARLEERFESHTGNVADIITRLEEQGGGIAAVEVRSRLEAALRAHEQLIARIALRSDAGWGDRDEVLALLSTVRLAATENTQALSVGESRIGSGEEGYAIIGDLARVKKSDAQEAFENAGGKYRHEKDHLPNDAQVRVEAKLAAAAIALGLAEEPLTTGDYAQAFVKFQESARLSDEAGITVLAAVAMEKTASEAAQKTE
jgi:hypothetical protein